MTQHNGQPCEVIRAIRRPDATHDRDVLPMFVVRFSDGSETEAWHDELSDSTEYKALTAPTTW